MKLHQIVVDCLVLFFITGKVLFHNIFFIVELKNGLTKKDKKCRMVKDGICRNIIN
jgi:hypothetical protein